MVGAGIGAGIGGTIVATAIITGVVILIMITKKRIGTLALSILYIVGYKVTLLLYTHIQFPKLFGRSSDIPMLSYCTGEEIN